MRTTTRPLWFDNCVMSDGRNPRPVDNYHNAILALRRDPAIKDALIFDEFAQQVLLVHPIGVPMTPYPEPQPITDSELRAVQEWMHSVGLKSMSLDNVAGAVNVYARERGFHPVRDFLDGLTWDNVDRSKWLSMYCGAADNEINQAFGIMFLISMVARIYEPGCKADYMLVLEGDQGILKSMICRALGAPWFSDSMPEVTQGKDASMHLRGKWVCEIPELHAFNRAETTHLKSFISRQSERYRPPYGRTEVEEPRQCVFMGTTNKDAYLKDETGGRRFWPVKIGKVNITALEDNRDQMIAQAVHDYRRGIAHWPGHEFEKKHITPLQESRYDADDGWEDPIAEHLSGKSEVMFTEILDVLEYSTGNGRDADNDPYSPGYGQPSDNDHKTPLNRLSKADQNRIKSILIKLGWERGGLTNDAVHPGRRIWVRRAQSV